ncbi:hypothetical protein Cob_v008418 [Colletotrichum orbiculare MAFF 240422]|uniref:Uncharacterized protein n=1 Tax=Colletotrichum orbiculare (strain 104-T / ATCC 96160 / CBS 514.97 / LARS 414 / MAFF 240422) TaxID=1213857 RepID=N4VW67_COLOR|nr:hypothetical protein Cob_v008418 [Colletotrichum orbiculare MAFF 240422]
MAFSLSTLEKALPTFSPSSNASSRAHAQAHVHAHAHARPTNTASPASSIWRDLPESLFRQHVVELERLTNSVPVDAQAFPLPAIERDGDGRLIAVGADAVDQDSESQQSLPLPRQLALAVEQQLADDMAYLVAVGEGAQSVAATTVQESRRRGPGRLRIAIASVDAIEPASQAFLRSVLQRLSAEPGAETCHHVLDEVVRHHHTRLLNRLRSCKWKKPAYLSRTHKKPLHADFANLVHRAQILYTKKEANMRAQLVGKLLALAALLEAFETAEDEDDNHHGLVGIVQSSYDTCTSPLIADYLQRLQGVRATTQVQACLKTLRQLEKIAAYHRICLTLTGLSRSHTKLFDNVELLFLSPYEAVPLTDDSAAYQSWAKSTHVHAEVILTVHHDLEAQQPQSEESLWHRPRCLGASKYFCYLCYLFIRHHGAYFAANTHGACYDQWTVPDLAEYPETLVNHYRGVLQSMDAEVRNRAQGDAVWRPEPMTSRENLISTTDQ